jgi:hypothetical protein
MESILPDSEDCRPLPVNTPAKARSGPPLPPFKNKFRKTQNWHKRSAVEGISGLILFINAGIKLLN